MYRSCLYLGLVGSVLGAVACSAGDGAATEEQTGPTLGGYSAAETESMLKAAESVGLERRRLAFQQGELVADSDMRLDPATLLGLRVNDGDGDFEGPGLAPLGYYGRAGTSSGRFTANPPRATSIHLVIDADVPSAWRTALRDAAAAWNPNACIDIREDRGNDVISARVDATLPAGVISLGYLPIVRQGVTLPGPQIHVTPNPPAGAAGLKYAAMHELGHTLGFMHPGSGTQLPGTSTDTKAGDASSYSTVMTLSGPNLSALSSDDIASRDAVFRRITKVVNGRQVTQCPDGTDAVPF